MTNNQNKRPEKSWWSIMADSIAIIIFVIAIFGMMGTFGTFCHGADAHARRDDVFNLGEYRFDLNNALHPHGLTHKDLRYEPPLLSYDVVPIESFQKVIVNQFLHVITGMHRSNYPMLSLENVGDRRVVFRRTYLNPQPHPQLFVRQATQPPVVLPDVSLEKSISTDSLEETTR